MAAATLNILVVDDQSSVRELLKAVLESDGFQVEVAHDGASAIAKLEEGFHDLVIMDIRMPGMDGIQALELMRESSPTTGVIMMTAYASVETAVKAMKLGAFDYVTKPIDIDEVRAVVGKFIELSQDESDDESVVTEPSSEIIGASESIMMVLDLVTRVAASDATVLVQGESGTGKELVAHEIHARSGRASRPFVAVNCSAIPEGLLESELFGHEKGAFTGAVRQRKGRFELADTGTIFLDEVGDMAPQLQAKLLRFLQDFTFQRVGGSTDLAIDVRVIAATNRNLEQEVHDGGFREDLYFRLNVVTITVPPLRDRKDDVPLLVEHFLRQHAQKGAKPKKMSPRALRLALRYEWPGNIRELENAIHRGVIISRGETIFPEHMPARVQATVGDDDDDGLSEGKTIREVERDIIVKTLKQTGGNRTKAAQILGISRRTLQNKIKEYGIK